MSSEEAYERGLQLLRETNGENGLKVLDVLADVSPELGNQVVGWAFGEISARPNLSRRDRQLLNLGMLTALGAEPQLELNINSALNIGLTPEEIVEAFLHALVYCGLPRALNATLAAKKVFAERGLLPVVPGGTNTS
jgi:4-carboxymuconolactone decarboxylase